MEESEFKQVEMLIEDTRAKLRDRGFDVTITYTIRCAEIMSVKLEFIGRLS